MRARRISIACALLTAAAGCDLPADDRNVQIKALPPEPGRSDPRLKLPPRAPGNAAAPAACGPGAEIREPYPCAGPCLQTPGFPAQANCIRSVRTCYRSRPAPPCPEPAPVPANAASRSRGG